MNQNTWWRVAAVLVVLFVAGFYALPNIYGDAPAVQISARSGDLPDDAMTQVEALLSDAADQVTDISVEEGRLIVRTVSTDAQLQIKDLLALELSERFIVTLNLVPATPPWMRSLAQPMALGLDLRGGVHFLMSVDVDAALVQYIERARNLARTELRTAKIRYSGVKITNQQLIFKFRSQDALNAASEQLREVLPDFTWESADDDLTLQATASTEALANERREAVKQNIVTLRNRVNELGVSEPVIQQQGADRIVVQLPGVQDTARAKNILGATATLEYRMVHGTPSDWDAAGRTGQAPSSAKIFRQRENGTPILLKREVIVTGDQITGASSGIDQQSGSPAVFVNLDGAGASRMQRVSSENIGNLMAVVFIEEREIQRKVDGVLVTERKHVEEVINTATIRDVLSNRFQTTGLDSGEAHDLALLLRSGALRAPMFIVEERTVGPSLGRDNIEQGMKSVAIGFAAVLICMLLYYKMFGLIANIALTANLVLLVAAMSLLQATLTMPGIAGIVLTVGMAVDANVLIFERIKEELRGGVKVQQAISLGYEKALATIADANITTLIAGVVLFAFGTGPIKGFAITLSIGILTSMFTAIAGTRILVNWIYGGKRDAKLAI